MICALFVGFLVLRVYKIYCKEPVLLPEIIKISLHLLEMHKLNPFKVSQVALPTFHDAALIRLQTSS